MKVLFIGDIYGTLGRQMIQENLPKIKEMYNVDILNTAKEDRSKGTFPWIK